jgi:hypothetical protein
VTRNALVRYHNFSYGLSNASGAPSFATVIAAQLGRSPASIKTMLILYNLLLGSIAIGLAWTLLQLRRKSIFLFSIALVILLAIPTTFAYCRYRYELDPHGTFGLIARGTWLVTIIALLLTTLSPLRKKPTLFVFVGILAYAIGFLIALTIGMNIGLYEK